jgi:hypothetical protein
MAVELQFVGSLMNASLKKRDNRPACTIMRAYDIRTFHSNHLSMHLVVLKNTILGSSSVGCCSWGTSAVAR